MVGHAAVAEIAAAKIDTGVTNLAALILPEIESITGLEIFKSVNRHSHASLLSRRTRKANPDFAVQVLNKARAVYAVKHVLAAPLVGRSDVAEGFSSHKIRGR